MRKTAVSILAFCLVIILAACDQEPAPPVSEDIREEIAREWTCELNDGDGVIGFTSVISLDADNERQILISNFNNQAAQAHATVYDDLTIVLPSQQLEGTSTSVEGIAEISSNFTRINWEYQVTDTEGEYSVTANFTLADIAKRLLSSL